MGKLIKKNFSKNIVKEKEENIVENEDKTSQETKNESIKEQISTVEKATIFLKQENSKFIEDFELQEYIGIGSESYVYKTKIKKNKRILAAKLIVKDKKYDINLNEINISRKLKNNNIINFYGASNLIKDKLDCIIMEYLKFGNLRNFQKILKRKTLSESLLCFITYQIINALKYCHRCKIAHLDLKPQNLVIDDFLTVKIIDFSISIDYSKINFDKIELPLNGTNFYIAPEVFSAKKINLKDLNKIDLYSVGVIIYNLAFGCYPFDLNEKDAKNYKSIYKKITSDFEIKNDKGFSPYFIDFLSKLLEKDIDKRMNIHEAINHYWLKGAEILLNEKDSTYNIGNFLIYLITDHIKNFNDYINKENKFFYIN